MHLRVLAHHTTKYKRAFEDSKRYLTTPFIFSKPSNREDFYIYLVVLVYFVSFVLVQLGKKIQRLIYYVNKELEDVETRYLDIEKVTLTLFMLAKKLCPYF